MGEAFTVALGNHSTQVPMFRCCYICIYMIYIENYLFVSGGNRHGQGEGVGF